MLRKAAEHSSLHFLSSISPTLTSFEAALKGTGLSSILIIWSHFRASFQLRFRDIACSSSSSQCTGNCQVISRSATPQHGSQSPGRRNIKIETGSTVLFAHQKRKKMDWRKDCEILHRWTGRVDPSPKWWSSTWSASRRCRFESGIAECRGIPWPYNWEITNGSNGTASSCSVSAEYVAPSSPIMPIYRVCTESLSAKRARNKRKWGKSSTTETTERNGMKTVKECT